MTVTSKSIKQRLLRDPAVRKEYDRLAPEFLFAASLIKARKRAKLTQTEVAERMGTSQSVIARLESGTQKPSTKTLERYAEATNSRLRIDLVAR
jgi:predicted transcriptional regulator